MSSIEELNLPLHSDQLVRTPLPCTLRVQFDRGVEFTAALRWACQNNPIYGIMCASWSTSWICHYSRMSLTEQHCLARYMCSLGEELNLPLHSWVCLNNSQYNTFTSHLLVVGGLVGGDLLVSVFAPSALHVQSVEELNFPLHSDELNWTTLPVTFSSVYFVLFLAVWPLPLPVRL